MNTYVKYGLLSAVIIGTLGWLAVGGVRESATYFKTIPEMKQMGDQAHVKRLRVTGYVEPGTIKHIGTGVTFTLMQNPEEQTAGALLTVMYNGSDPLPDTFKDYAQALAEGKLGPDNVFRANKIQAKCASKYEAKPPVVPNATPVKSASNI